MSRFWSDVVHTLTPYVPGEQPKMDRLVKLNTNESPYGPSPRVIDAVRDAASEDLRRYPDPNADALKQCLATYHGLEPAQVFVGNGSDEVLAHAFMGLLKHDKPLLFPDITYSFYPVYCGLYDIAHRLVPLNECFEIDPADYTGEAGAVIFPNPNAPTGRLMPLEAVEQILKAQPDVVVLVDEAYIDYGGQSAVGLLAEYPNLLITRTFSKSRALAGLRVGYALGSTELVEGRPRPAPSLRWKTSRGSATAASGSSTAVSTSPARWSAWASRYYPPRPTSFSRATRRIRARIWRRPCESVPSSCVTSSCRASTLSCASRSAPTMSATPSSKRSETFSEAVMSQQKNAAVAAFFIPELNSLDPIGCRTRMRLKPLALGKQCRDRPERLRPGLRDMNQARALLEIVHPQRRRETRAAHGR